MPAGNSGGGIFSRERFFMALTKEFKKDCLFARAYDSRAAMGEAAAHDCAAKLRELLAKKSEVNVIFAAAPSQNEMLASLIREPGIDWSRVNAFHMDEYVGLPADAPQGFGNFLRDRIFSKLPFKSVSYLNGQCADREAECARYSSLLRLNPVDIVCMGIGENGHIAFNDPPVADFRDPRLVKVVALDEVCRNQQVHDGCFKTLADVPTHAFSLTVPALMKGAYLYCVVPAATKAEAVRRMLTWDVSEACPATALRRHENSFLYLDADSSSLLGKDA